MLWKETLLFLYGSQFKVYCLCLILEFTTWCDDVCGGQFFDNKLLSIMLWNCDNWLFCLSCSDMTHTLNTSLFVHNCHLSPVSIQTQSLALESSQSWLPLLRPSIPIGCCLLTLRALMRDTFIWTTKYTAIVPTPPPVRVFQFCWKIPNLFWKFRR